MRLIDTHTGEFLVVADHHQVSYAILSHTWDPEGEQSYQEVRDIRATFWRRSTATTLFFAMRYLLRLCIAKEVATSAGYSASHRIRKRFLHRLLEWMQRLFAATASKELSIFHSVLSDVRLSKKLREACALCRRDDYKYLWFDACCIDKTNSAELSEAINSMFLWYKHSAVCFAFLSDVSQDEDPVAEGSAFRLSRWFTRGWTLQELLAPAVVVFVSKEWQVIGTKGTLGFTLEEITRIPRDVLWNCRDPKTASAAQRMAWAARRATAREEDEAYCLIGLFGVRMRTAYGEGRYAFIRLQEEILKQGHDESIFAWCAFVLYDREGRPQIPRPDYLRPSPGSGIWPGVIPVRTPGAQLDMDAKDMPALSPGLFMHCAGVVSLGQKEFRKRLGLAVAGPAWSSSSRGLRARLPLMPVDAHVFNDMPFPDELPVPRSWYLAVLACEDLEYHIDGHLLAVVCSFPDPPQGPEYAREGNSQAAVHLISRGFQTFLPHPESPLAEGSAICTVVLTPADIEARRDSIRLVEVEISMHPPLLAEKAAVARRQLLKRGPATALTPSGTYPIRSPTHAIQIAPWCHTALRAQGFAASEVLATSAGPQSYSFVVTKDGAELLMQCMPVYRTDPTQGAAIQVRFQQVVHTFPVGVSTVDPIRFWDRVWGTVSEAMPLITGGFDAGGRMRVVRLTFKYDDGACLLGIEPLAWDESPDVATMFRVDTRL